MEQSWLLTCFVIHYRLQSENCAGGRAERVIPVPTSPPEARCCQVAEAETGRSPEGAPSASQHTALLAPSCCSFTSGQSPNCLKVRHPPWPASSLPLKEKTTLQIFDNSVPQSLLFSRPNMRLIRYSQKWAKPLKDITLPRTFFSKSTKPFRHTLRWAQLSGTTAFLELSSRRFY